jgi:acetyl-CoA carboxylase carboxyl transferase subunit beta
MVLTYADAQSAVSPPNASSSALSTRLSTLPAHATLWVRCPNPSCRAQLYAGELQRAFKVCPQCSHHFRLSAPERIEQLVDPGSFEERDATVEPADPLGFVSAGQSYRDKVCRTQQQAGLREAALCGSARLGGFPVELVVMDFGFLGGSMGTVVGEKLVRSVDRAVTRRCPLVSVTCSGGARMHEGLIALMQMARTAAAVARLHQARLPFLSVLADPTTGGVTASFATLGDVLLAEPGALIAFAGPRVIEQVTKQKLPPGAQRAEFLLERGLLDMIVQRRELRPWLVQLLRLYAAGAPTGTAHARN